MSPAVRDIFADWSPSLILSTTILLVASIYVRGWFAIRRTRLALFPDWRLISFVMGLVVLWAAIDSPLDGFADVLLSAHMVQHVLLMSVVPPLILLGAPMVPMLRGLPRRFTKVVLGPVFRWQPLLQIGRFLTKPIVAWLTMNLTFVLWHLPRAYDFALWNENWHRVEHICFLTASLLFWWPVIEPWPAKKHEYGWGLLLYLLSADFINTGISAFLAFCDRPVYSYYLVNPNPFEVNPLSDQILGAALMWVVGSVVFLVPAVATTMRLLQGSSQSRANQTTPTRTVFTP